MAIFASAKVFGKVIVGRRAFVGANAVVTKDVPAWHVAMGVPASVHQPRDRQEHELLALPPDQATVVQWWRDFSGSESEERAVVRNIAVRRPHAVGHNGGIRKNGA